jgi:hypothetical protein
MVRLSFNRWHFFKTAVMLSVLLFLAGLQCCAGFAAQANLNARDTLPKTWSNPQGLTLTEVKKGVVYGAERPFIWNTIDVGGRMAVIKLNDGSLWIHSPVDLDPALRDGKCLVYRRFVP